jgi:hypothetical protein
MNINNLYIINNVFGRLRLYILLSSVSIILKWILERWDGVDWMDMAQDRDQWRALVNTVLNLRVP